MATGGESRSANPARGEVVVALGGARRRLCLTLGGLAAIEAALGLEDWSQLPARLARPSARDLLAVLEALVDDDGGPLDARRIDLAQAVAAVGQALAAAS